MIRDGVVLVLVPHFLKASFKQKRTHIHSDQTLDWSRLHHDSCLVHFVDFTVQNFSLFRDAAHRSELHFENHVATCILDDAISNVLKLLLALTNTGLLKTLIAYSRRMM